MDTNTKGCERDFGDSVNTNAFEHCRLTLEVASPGENALTLQLKNLERTIQRRNRLKEDLYYKINNCNFSQHL